MFVNKRNFFCRYFPIIGYKQVNSAFFVSIGYFSLAKRFLLFILFVLQMNVLNLHYACLFFGQFFFKKCFYNLIICIIFENMPSCVHLTNWKYQLYALSKTIIQPAVRQLRYCKNFLSCIRASLILTNLAQSAWTSVSMCTFRPPFCLPRPLSLRPTPFKTSEKSRIVVESKAKNCLKLTPSFRLSD